MRETIIENKTLVATVKLYFVIKIHHQGSKFIAIYIASKHNRPRYYSMASCKQITGILCNILGFIVGEKVTKIEKTHFQKQEGGIRQCEKDAMMN